MQGGAETLTAPRRGGGHSATLAAWRPPQHQQADTHMPSREHAKGSRQREPSPAANSRGGAVSHYLRAPRVSEL